jgi:hypothetical protein
MEPEISARLKATANLIGYSENQFIVEAVKAMLDVAEDKNNAVPRVVVLIRSARRSSNGSARLRKPATSQRFGHRRQAVVGSVMVTPRIRRLRG